jgi:hypothetical protein
MADHSLLAGTLKQIYLEYKYQINKKNKKENSFFSLQSRGEIKVIINNWLNVSCCLPHRSIAMNCPLEVDYAFNVLSNAEQYLKYD